MRKTLLIPAFAAAALALGLAACDEQPASENPAQPMQQGAMPPPASDMAPAAQPNAVAPEQPNAVVPEMTQPDDSDASGSALPGSSQ